MLIELINENKVISMMGMAKNCGKTVAMNRILEEAFERDMKVGLTSIGRDGETVDVATETEKPRIYLDRGSVFATSEMLLQFADARVEILENTSFRTPVGEIIIARVREPGYVEIAGPQLLSEQKKLNEKLLEYGVDFVVIDGAIDRISQAQPAISDAAILASGACLSRDLNRTVEMTAQMVEVLSLKQTDAIGIRKNYEEYKDFVCIEDKNSQVEVLPFKSAMNKVEEILDRIDENTRYLYIPTSLTKNILDNLSGSKFAKDIEIVVKDGTKLFVDSNSWKKYLRHGMNFSVIDAINLLCVTINPSAPQGYFYDAEEFLKAMRENIPRYKVFNVMDY